MAFAVTGILILIAVVAISHQEVVQLAPGLHYENCGPPFKVILSPNPPQLRQALNITVEVVAAHDLIAGVIEAYFNVWPYYFKDAYCADGKILDQKGCYISKGEKKVFSWTIWVDDSFKEKIYEGNGTVRNQDDELMVCARGWFKF